MKVAVECKSPLLQKSLELFLSNYLSSLKHCDIVVRDVECLNDERCFYVSNNQNADLIKPFSKAQLILALENRYDELNKDEVVAESEESSEKSSNEPMDFDILEKRIEYLTKEYQENILRAVKAFYEN